MELYLFLFLFLILFFSLKGLNVTEYFDKISTLKALFCFYLGCGFFLSKMDPWMVDFHFKWQTWKERFLVFKGNWMPQWCWMLATSLVQFSEWCFNYKRKTKQYLRIVLSSYKRENSQDVQEYKKKERKEDNMEKYILVYHEMK